MKTLIKILMLCLPMAAMGETYICTTENGNYTDVYTRTDNGFSRRLRNNEENIDIRELRDFIIINEQGSLLTLVEAESHGATKYAI